LDLKLQIPRLNEGAVVVQANKTNAGEIMTKLIEHECMICGDHEMCNPDIINICRGCDNGIMKKYTPE
jgi:hypothetical protein